MRQEPKPPKPGGLCKVVTYILMMVNQTIIYKGVLNMNAKELSKVARQGGAELFLYMESSSSGLYRLDRTIKTKHDYDEFEEKDGEQKVLQIYAYNNQIHVVLADYKEYSHDCQNCSLIFEKQIKLDERKELLKKYGIDNDDVLDIIGGIEKEIKKAQNAIKCLQGYEID